jgi:hypothetical protein
MTTLMIEFFTIAFVNYSFCHCLASRTVSSHSSSHLFWCIFPSVFFAVVLSVVILVVKSPAPDVWQRYRPLAFIFCTPVPLLLCFWGYYMYDSRFDDINQQGMEWSNGYVYEYKTTVDESADPMQIVTRFRKADSLSYSLRGDSALVRDSVWVYLDLKSRDTLRLERYRHDTLMQTILGTKH